MRHVFVRLFRRILCAALPAVLLASALPGTALAAEPAGRSGGAPSLSAQCSILVDGDTGQVLYAHNAQETRPIASITKIMTAVVVLDRTENLEEQVLIQPEWTGLEGSSMYLKPGDTVSVRTLLYGMMLASGNDAATALACWLAGDTDTFAQWMNDTAQALGMEHTHFTNPHGLDDEGHYSTAEDMAVLMRCAMDHPDFAEITGTRSITAEGYTLSNHNKLLSMYPECVGGKTGYTMSAGRTLVTAAERDGRRLIAVTLSDSNDWQDHIALYEFGFALPAGSNA